MFSDNRFYVFIAFQLNYLAPLIVTFPLRRLSRSTSEDLSIPHTLPATGSADKAKNHFRALDFAAKHHFNLL